MNDLTNNLIILQDKSNIKLFKKNSSHLILRDVVKILDECNKVKRKKLIELSNSLKSISYGQIDINKIKKIQDDTYNSLIDVEEIINILTNNKNINNINDSYIESYEN